MWVCHANEISAAPIGSGTCTASSVKEKVKKEYILINCCETKRKLYLQCFMRNYENIYKPKKRF